MLDLDRAGIENRVHLRDVKDLPFENDTFDAVIGAHVLEHFDGLFAGSPRCPGFSNSVRPW